MSIHGLSKVPAQTIHWQKSPPVGLVFGSEGQNLLSGGGETVLVKYALHSDGRYTKEFMARVGAPIVRITLSQDNSRSAMVLADNSKFLYSFPNFLGVVPEK